jgi:hypothetical protein
MLHFRFLPTFAHFYGHQVFINHIVFFTASGLFTYEQDHEEQ